MEKMKQVKAVISLGLGVAREDPVPLSEFRDPVPDQQVVHRPSPFSTDAPR